MAEPTIICSVCGFNNDVNAERCHSCGAKLEELRPSYTPEEREARRYQQEGFDWRWAGIAATVFIVLQALILAGLPKAIATFDPQGLPGLMVSAGVWFFGGIAVGFKSPGKTFIEPAAGALMAVPPTIAYLAVTTPAGFQPSMMAYIVFSLLGVMLALFGAFIGERAQMNGAHPT